MRISYRAICLLVLLILAAPVVAVPATALAQSAGDDQYVDPFENDGNDKGGDNSGNQGSDQGTSNDTSSQSGSDTGTQGTTAAAQSTEDANGKLPRTGGVPEGWIAVAGVALLLGGGFALRRVWPRPD
jgi:LPXTG-motif cell wall-anchored protein